MINTKKSTLLLATQKRFNKLQKNSNFLDPHQHLSNGECRYQILSVKQEDKYLYLELTQKTLTFWSMASSPFFSILHINDIFSESLKSSVFDESVSSDTDSEESHEEKRILPLGTPGT